MKFSARTGSSLPLGRSTASAIGSAARGATPRGATTRASAASPWSSRSGPSPGTATTADGTAARSRTLSERHAKALEERGLDPEVAVRLGFYTAPGKFAGKDGLAIPMVREGRVINHKYRGPRKQFAQDEGAPRSLWNEDVLRDKTLAHLPVLITEGEMDGVAGVQVAGDVARVVSVIDGAGSNLDFFAGIWGLLEAVPRFILAGDGDEPGQKLNAELARRLGAARCAWLQYPTGKDLNDVLKALGPSAAMATIEAAKPYPIKGVYRLSEFPSAGELQVMELGWASLNPFLKLWVPELMVITGIPSHGKSKLALHMLCQLVERHGARPAIFSAEMPIKPHVRDELRAYHGGTPEEADAWIEENFVFIGSDPRDIEDEADVAWLLEKGGDAVVRYGINWLLIDPWNQLEHRRNRESIEEYQERALRDVNRFRRSFQCGVIVVVHPTKDVKGKDGKLRMPGLYDVSGSAHWYNAPDHGLAVHRTDGGGTSVQVAVLKARFSKSGHAGTAWLRFNPERGRYESRVPPEAKEGG